MNCPQPMAEPEPRPNPPQRRRLKSAAMRKHPRFFSRALRNSRDLVVWLPPGYGNPRRRHPVVYFQDGQNIFDPATAFNGNAWHAGEAADRLVRSGEITPPILVGVANTGANRINEYTPTKGEYDAPGGGKAKSAGDAKRYARFFTEEVKPFIDDRYLTLPGPRTTAVVGSSLGGLVSLYFGLWHPRVYGTVAAMSPSLWWDNRVVFHDFGRLPRRPDVRIWLDTGTAEPGWDTAPLFRDLLVGRGWTQGLDLEYQEYHGADHSEGAWAARIGDVLKFVLRRE